MIDHTELERIAYQNHYKSIKFQALGLVQFCEIVAEMRLGYEDSIDSLFDIGEEIKLVCGGDGYTPRNPLTSGWNGYNLALEIAHIYLEDKTPEKSLDRLADMLMSAKTDIENFRGHTSNLIGMFNCWAKIADEEMNKEPYLRMPASGSSSDRFIQQISLGDRKKY
ncbi:hypothetical protein J4216_02800 [Candidatus Woesearchaeota archaeon]|nr:hypothetical protein [Candidatus Woesearchaeota archaeon]